MDEFAVAQEVINAVLNTSYIKQGKKILRVKVKGGVARMIVPEQLRSAFEILSNDTLLQGAQIEFEEVPGDGLEIEYIETE